MKFKGNSLRKVSVTREEIIKTMTASFRFGSWMRKVQEIMKIATRISG